MPVIKHTQTHKPMSHRASPDNTISVKYELWLNKNGGNDEEGGEQLREGEMVRNKYNMKEKNEGCRAEGKEKY